MIIFAGIISSLPTTISEICKIHSVNIDSSRMSESIIFVSILVVAAVLAIVYFTTYVQQAEYKITHSIHQKSTRGSVQFLLATKTKSRRCHSCHLCRIYYSYSNLYRTMLCKPKSKLLMVDSPSGIL